MPTLNHYLRHATQFGTDCVIPTALADGDLSARELVELKVGVAKIAADHRRAKKPATWSDDVVKVDARDVLALDREGFTETEIVTHTKLSARVVAGMLAKKPEPVSFDRTMPSTDVSGWDRQIMAGDGGSDEDRYETPRNHAGSTSQNRAESADGYSEPSERQAQYKVPPNTAESRAKAAATRAAKTAQIDADIIRLRVERKMVPGGIARVLKVGEARVRRVLRAAGC